MSERRWLNRIGATATLAVVAAAVQFTGSAALAQTAVRPEVGRSLQAAQQLIKAGKYREALAKVHEADAVGGKSAAENNVVERMRLAAASGAGDADTAAKSFDAISASVAGPDKLRMIESIAGTYYRAKEYAKAQQWYARYFKEGGTSSANRTLMIQTQYLSGDFAGASKELTAEIQAAEKSGAAPAEDRIKLLMNAALKQNDNGGYVYAVEKLVTYYPKKEYWADLLSRLQRKPTFSDRFALDVYRLSLATGVMAKASDYMEMAQLAVQAGYPAEGKQVADKGFAAGVLGTGAEAERHKRLQDLMVKRAAEKEVSRAKEESDALAAKDGNALVNVGYDLVVSGQPAKGIGLIQQGIAKGGLKRPEDAKLHLGVAQLVSGDKTKAQTTFKSVTGNDGAGDLARLWALYARRA